MPDFNTSAGAVSLIFCCPANGLESRSAGNFSVPVPNICPGIRIMSNVCKNNPSLKLFLRVVIL